MEPGHLMLKAALAVACLALTALSARAAPVTPEVVKDLAPTGKLRAAINYGNPVLAQRDEGSGELRGVSVDLARELARRLGVEVALVPFDAAGKVTDAARTGAWDIAFLAVDPVRAADIAFTSPYVIIEGTYMVRQDSPLRAIDDVDREGVRIAVGRGSAYDLYLTRAIKRAALVREPTSAAAIETFAKGGVDVAAGVKQPLVTFANANAGFRVMEGRFMAIEQAMGTPQARPAALAYLQDFVEEMKASGFIAEALARSRQPDATVAPARPRP